MYCLDFQFANRSACVSLSQVFFSIRHFMQFLSVVFTIVWNFPSLPDVRILGMCIHS